MEKISIRFYNDHEVRAVWSEEDNKWFFSVLDVIGAINDQEDYAKTRNYWKYLKAKLKKDNNELVSVTTQLKLRAAEVNHTMFQSTRPHGARLLVEQKTISACLFQSTPSHGG